MNEKDAMKKKVPRVISNPPVRKPVVSEEEYERIRAEVDRKEEERARNAIEKGRKMNEEAGFK